MLHTKCACATHWVLMWLHYAWLPQWFQCVVQDLLVEYESLGPNQNFQIVYTVWCQYWSTSTRLILTHWMGASPLVLHLCETMWTTLVNSVLCIASCSAQQHLHCKALSATCLSHRPRSSSWALTAPLPLWPWLNWRSSGTSHRQVTHWNCITTTTTTTTS